MIYIQKFIKIDDDLPKDAFDVKYICHSKDGLVFNQNPCYYMQDDIDWYLLHRELPTDDEIKKACSQELPVRVAPWIQGAKWLRDKLMGK